MMFDYSLLGSFALFLVVAFIKIRPVAAKQVDECIKDIRGSFDEADERIKSLKSELQFLQKHAEDMEVSAEIALQEACAEAKVIEAETLKTIEYTRQYYAGLCKSQERYWEERLTQYRNDLVSAQVLEALQGYCSEKSNAKKVHAVTKVLTAVAR